MQMRSFLLCDCMGRVPGKRRSHLWYVTLIKFTEERKSDNHLPSSEFTEPSPLVRIKIYSYFYKTLYCRWGNYRRSPRFIWCTCTRCSAMIRGTYLCFLWHYGTIYLFLNINKLGALNFIISLFQASTCFEHMCSSSGGQKLYYTVSGIIILKQVSGLKLLK